MVNRFRRSLHHRARHLAWRLTAPQVHEAIDEARREASGLAEAVGQRLANDPTFAAKAVPRARTSNLVSVPAVESRKPSDEMPLPPRDLWAVHDRYLESGQRDATRMRSTLSTCGLDLSGGGKKVLDFGCGTGRVIRHLVDLAREGEVWGADLSSERIDWCRSNLTPPFRFVTTSTTPHLPFEDRSFDLVYAGSVFTHIVDQDDAWLLELRRITRPGGFLYLTVMDRHMINLVLSQDTATPYTDWFAGDLETEVDLDEAFRTGVAQLGDATGMFAVVGDGFIPNVFHDVGHLEQTWGRVLEMLDVIPEAWFKQAAVVLRRPT